jgi:signal transduction histidine kinase/HD-like signal output (HDOD) protein
MFLAQSMLSAEKIGSLISAPQVVARLLGACQEPATAPGELSEIVLQDGVLCAKIIDAAARACPNSLDPASPVTSALTRLTLPIVKSLALQSAKSLAASRFTPEQAHFLRQLWFFSRAAGCIAHATAKAVAYPAPEEAQVTAMLMNVGMLALFSHDPETYIQNIDSPFSSKEVRTQEQVSFEVDHLQLLDALVSGWGGDSFMAEAIRFAHLDPESSRESSTLVKIAQLANEICKSPLSLEKAGVRKAEQLFDLKETATTALFRRAESQYRASSPLECRQDESLQELTKAGERLSALAFSLLEQETVRCHFACAEETINLVSSARQLYLHHSSAMEAVFFLFDQPGCRLVGLPSAHQSRLVADLATPLTAANLLASAAREGKLLHSFEAGAGTLSVFDRQLIRICKGGGIACLPLRMGDRPVGGVVLGLNTPGAVELLNSPKLGWINRTLARTLAALSNETAAAGRASEGRNIDPIPRLAHEIRNPLAIINNYLHVLGNLLKGSENEGIFSAVAYQAKRIDEILTYYSTGNDTPKPSNSGVDLNAAIVSVVESLRPAHFDPKKIEVITDFDTTIGSIFTNPVAIKQILVNLLTNAAEAITDDGRVVITSREQITSDGLRYVAIGVEDNGPGIDRRIMKKLFSPVATTKGGNHAGLGLSIAKGMADDIGATLRCHTGLSGTTFSLMIPQAE